jgi:hypothetical protein
MLCKDGDNFGALPLEVPRAWASGKNIPFLIGPDIIKVIIKVSKQDLKHLKVPETSTILY